jgi:catechol 2,3-dioxygenase-like lactoylglutathione lyase family enzyme
MLGDANICPTLPVRDLEAAKTFYEQTLGLKKSKEDPGGVLYESGKSFVYVYPSQFAGTNQATAASWSVDDAEATIESLRQKGITFEHYDNIPGATLQGDVHVMGPAKAAWFKDPDGNILSITSGM